MGKRSKKAKPVQLALPMALPEVRFERKPWSLPRSDAKWSENRHLYYVWAQMIYRCERPAHVSYAVNGGRGIKVCAEWRHSFAAFLRDMSPRPVNSALARKDESRDYEPSNCYWVSSSERISRAVSRQVAGFSSQKEAALSLGLSVGAVNGRLRRGFCPEHAATLPRRARKPVDCPACQGGAVKYDVSHSGNGPVSAAGLVTRLRDGWCEEHAASVPKGRRRPIGCSVCQSRIGARRRRVSKAPK